MNISRRQILQGFGTVLALPWLESTGFASGTACSGAPPLRTAFIYLPNGMRMSHWRPRGPSETCLLYTSPSPRDLSTSRMPSSA